MTKNTTDREEWRNWLASHGLPHNEVEGELILDFIDGLISNREKLARKKALNDMTVWANNEMAKDWVRKELDGEEPTHE